MEKASYQLVKLEMSDVSAEVISATKVHRALQQLLDTYLLEKEESRREDDEQHVEYWDSACQTIYDVAAALDIPLEEEQEEELTSVSA
jgi:hypothetical protein